MKHIEPDATHCPISKYVTTRDADEVIAKLMSNQTSDGEFQSLADRLQANFDLTSNLDIISSLIVRRHNERRTLRSH
ncbi:MAG TPA: hypothetical protein VFC63_07575 [Blastocatellia bacterium]|nr:hypothetical protein [Blastocatellia bacterium]